MCSELGWDLFCGFTDSAMRTLLEHTWPGNVRELKNTVERSLYRWADAGTPVGNIVIDPFVSPYAEPPLPTPPPAPASINQSTTLPLLQATRSFTENMESIEKNLLSSALAEYQGNQRETAEALGLSYDQLRGLVRKHKLSNRKRK